MGVAAFLNARPRYDKADETSATACSAADRWRQTELKTPAHNDKIGITLFPSQAAECYYGAEGVRNSSIFVFGCIVYTDPLGVKPTTQALSRHHRIVDFCAPSLLVSLRLRCWRSPASWQRDARPSCCNPGVTPVRGTACRRHQHNPPYVVAQGQR